MGARKIIKTKEGWKVLKRNLFFLWIVCGYWTPFGYKEIIFKTEKNAREKILINESNYIIT